jgi:hypothetical protein
MLSAAAEPAAAEMMPINRGVSIRFMMSLSR